MMHILFHLVILLLFQKEVNSFFLLNSEEYNECFNLLRDVRDLLINKFQVNDFNIGINDGCNAGQTINQCHLHIIPRYQGDIDNPRGGIRGVIPSKKLPMIFKIVNFNNKPELEIHQSGVTPRKIRRDSRARYYKPLCLLVTLDAIEDGEISWNNIEPKIIINRFKYILENFDSGKSIEMGWMPFWHLSPLDKIWNCYKNGLIIRRSNFPPQGKPKTKQQLLGAINYASINEDFKDYFIDIDKRKKLKQLLIDLLLREKDLISKKIAYHYLIHSDSLSLRTQGQMDDEKIRIAIEIEAMRRTRKELEKKGGKL